MTSISIGTMSKAKKMIRRRSHCIQSNSLLTTIEEHLFSYLHSSKTTRHRNIMLPDSICLNNGVGNGSIHPRPYCEMLLIWPECFRRKPWPSSKRYLRKEVGKKSSTRAHLWYHGEGDSPAERSGSSSGLLQRKKEEAYSQKCSDYHLDRASLVCGSNRSGQDTGYQGYAPRNTAIIQPAKKPRGKELTTEQKAKNKVISSTRIKVEHAISGIKNQRMVKDLCRLRKNHFVDKIIRPYEGGRRR